MRRRRGFNPKRQIAAAADVPEEMRALLQAKVSYGGNPEHKRSPGDYGLTPPSKLRAAKTLCDVVRPILKEEALVLLKSGLAKGMVSKLQHGDFPQNVWAVDDAGQTFEAQLENRQLGVYHGYPMPQSDTFRKTVLKEWADR